MDTLYLVAIHLRSKTLDFAVLDNVTVQVFAEIHHFVSLFQDAHQVNLFLKSLLYLCFSVEHDITESNSIVRVRSFDGLVKSEIF